MKDIDYATAVARVKINENNLITPDGIDRLINAKTLEEAVSMLNEKGYSVSGAPIEQLFDNQLENAWKLVEEIAPDFKEFHFLLVKNDFHNLKAVLKGIVSDKDYDNLCISPTITEPKIIAQAISEQKWSLLPVYMQNVAQQAYEYFVNTGDGRLSDMCIDKGSLNAVVDLSKDNKNDFISGLGDLIAVTYNLRIAVRAAIMKMDKDYLKKAICDNCSMDANALIEAASLGFDEVSEYIAKSKYEDAAVALEKSVYEFEKWCDNALIKYVEKARYVSFTASPIAAYIIKKEAELKTVRIIISGKQTNMNEADIKARVRDVY